MEFFEFVFAFSIVFVLPVTLVKMSLDYKKAKALAETGSGEASGVTAGELRRLLREAVEDANAPLLARIDSLEEQIRPGSSETIRDAFGEDFEDETGTSGQERTLGRRVTD